MALETGWTDPESRYHKPLFDRIQQKKRDRILHAATTEFASYGFERANINHIAEKAGVSVGSLYKYFGTKKNLFQYIVRVGLSKLQEVLEAVSGSSDIPLMSRIETVLRAILATSRSFKDMIRLYLEISATGKRSQATALAFDIESPSARVYSHLLSEARDRGEIRSDIDPGTTAFLIDNLFMSLQFSCVSDYYKERCRIFTGKDIYENQEKIIAQTLSFVRNALAPTSKGGKRRG